MPDRNDVKELITKSFHDHIDAAEKTLAALSDQIAEVGQELIDCLSGGGKILFCGNGGSAADAQHLAAEFTGRFLISDRRPLAAVALSTDTSALTAIGNDFGFDEVFARQVTALGTRGDVLFAISTSGKSKNLTRALAAAQEAGCRSVALLGRDGGQMKEMADLALVVPCRHTPHIQEMHITIGHILCDLVDRHFGR